jgi:hypothetical protein
VPPEPRGPAPCNPLSLDSGASSGETYSLYRKDPRIRGRCARACATEKPTARSPDSRLCSAPLAAGATLPRNAETAISEQTMIEGRIPTPQKKGAPDLVAERSRSCRKSYDFWVWMHLVWTAPTTGEHLRGGERDCVESAASAAQALYEAGCSRQGPEEDRHRRPNRILLWAKGEGSSLLRGDPALFSRVQTWGQVAIETGIAKQQRIVEPVCPGEFTTPRSRTPRELVGV